MFSLDGRFVVKVKEFEEDILEIEFEKIDNMFEVDIYEDILWIKKVFVFGIRDYFEKIGIIKKVVVGFFGGIDFLVVCCLVIEVFGRENVFGVVMLL